MQIIDVEQGSDEWWDAKCGKPGSSMFSSILTPPTYVEYFDCGNPDCRHRSEAPAQKCKKGLGKATPAMELNMKPSGSWEGYQNKLLAERLRGLRDDTFCGDWMKRGHVQEAAGGRAYGFITNQEIIQVGFCLSDDGRYGCSPDRLVGDEGGLEVKAPSPGVHVGYMRRPNEVPGIYKPQVLGNLLVTERPWWDFISYHPDFEPVIVRTWAEEVADQLKELEEGLHVFCDELDWWEKKLRGQQDGVIVFDSHPEEEPSAAGVFG